MRLSQLPIGSFYLFKMLFSACSLSLSLAILALLTVSSSDVLDLAPPTHPPLFCVLLLFHLFSGGTEMLLKTKVKLRYRPALLTPCLCLCKLIGKKRLILDLWRNLLTYLKMHVKYEDLKTAISYFVRGAYMFCFDLKSGYHHVKLPLTVLLPLILFFLLPL